MVAHSANVVFVENARVDWIDLESAFRRRKHDAGDSLCAFNGRQVGHYASVMAGRYGLA